MIPVPSRPVRRRRAFKLCAALDGCPPEEMLDYCGDLAAVGTVADVMPLTGENRTLVKAGLHLLQHSDRPGLLALLDEVGLGGKPVTAENVSYAIAPRINAAGRMDSAVTALQLVLCEDEERAAELAHKLNEINAARQETEGEIAKRAGPAGGRARHSGGPGHPDLGPGLASRCHWHRGIPAGGKDRPSRHRGVH